MTATRSESPTFSPLFDRRLFLAGAAATGAITASGARASAGEQHMYGLIGKMTAKQGKRDELIATILGDGAPMPGCLSYIVSRDPAHPDIIWITEAWESKAAHAASLSLPSVEAAIAKGRPLIAGMELVAEVEPVGGQGLSIPACR